MVISARNVCLGGNTEGKKSTRRKKSLTMSHMQLVMY